MGPLNDDCIDIRPQQAVSGDDWSRSGLNEAWSPWLGAVAGGLRANRKLANRARLNFGSAVEAFDSQPDYLRSVNEPSFAITRVKSSTAANSGMPRNLRLWLDDLLFRVIVPVVEKNLFVVLGGGGVVDDDSGIPIIQDALSGPV